MDSNEKGITQELDTYLCGYQDARHYMGSVLVAKGGEVLLAKGYGMANLEHNVPNTPDTAFRIGSISKQFTAAAVLKLQEQGLLDVSNTISVYLPDYPQGDKVTLHQALTHSAGIPSFTGFEDYEVFKKQPTTLVQTVNRFKDLPLEFSPGTKFSYSNSGYVLLAHIIEQVSGQSYADFLQEHFFKPLGMAFSGDEKPEALIMRRASGYIYTGRDYGLCDYVDMRVPTGGGSLYSSVTDLYRWLQALYRGEILSANSFEMMQSPLVVTDHAQDGSVSYGYGLFSSDLEGHRLIGNDGGIEGFVSSAWHYPNDDLSAIVLSNVENCNPFGIGQALAAIAFGKTVAPPVKRAAIEVAPDIMVRYEGDYELSPDFVLSIRMKNGRLFSQATGQSEIELFALSETEYFPTVVDAQISFIVEDGSVNQLILHQNGKDVPAKKLRACL